MSVIDAYEQSRQRVLAVLQADILAGMANLAAGQITSPNAESIKQRGRAALGSKES